MIDMIIWRGSFRDTEVAVTPIDMGSGAGRIACIECGGSGDWTPYHPEPEKGPFPCVECKGTGMTLVSI